MGTLLNRDRKMTKEEIASKKAILDDSRVKLTDRVAAHLAIREEMMNPKEEADFDPATFDPMEGIRNHDIIKRGRKDPPRRLPNPHGMKPKEILEGQMIGMYESKQDLYLLIVWLSERLSDVEEELERLRGG